MAFKARWVGAHLSGAGLKSWGARGGVQPLLREKLGVEFPLKEGHHARVGLRAQLCLGPFQSFQCVFSHLPDMKELLS